jgi:succinoglycan biosynthesis protein ExoA
VSNIYACVQSVLAQEEPEGGFELIVADGQSDDGTRDILDDLSADNPRMRVVTNAARTTAAGMNAGIMEAHGDYIAIMGAHNRYAPDYLTRCLELASTTRADNIGGVVQADPQTYVERAIAAAHHSSISAGGSYWHSLSHDGPVDSVWGGFYRRSVFDRVGLFDEELIRNQDDEFNLRLREAGGTIWQSTRIQSWYRPRSSLGKLFAQYRQYGYWRLRVLYKHPASISPRQLVPPAFVSALCCSIVLSAWQVAKPTGSAAHTAKSLIYAAAPVALVGTPYGLLIGAASIRAARTAGWDLLPVLPATFICYHVGYGFGFLLGGADLLRQRTARASMSALTR